MFVDPKPYSKWRIPEKIHDYPDKVKTAHRTSNGRLYYMQYSKSLCVGGPFDRQVRTYPETVLPGASRSEYFLFNAGMRAVGESYCLKSVLVHQSLLDGAGLRKENLT